MRDGEYDVVIFNEVFEHLRINPIFTMREVHRILKPEGILMLSTPNLTSWKGWCHFAFKGRLAPDVYDQFAKLAKLGHMGHVGIHSVGEVVSFLRRIGFDIETVSIAGNSGRHAIGSGAWSTASCVSSRALLGHRGKAPSPAGLVDRRAAGGRDVKCALPRSTPK